MSDIKIGDTFWYLDADVSVVAVGSPDDAFPVRDGEIGIRAMSSDDADTLGWSPCTNGEYEAVTARAQFLAVAEQTTLEQPNEPFDLANFMDAVSGAPATEVLTPTEATQDHGPLAAVLSDRTLAKVLSRPAHVPPGEATPVRVFGFNVVTISPQGIPGGPRLDGVVSRQRAQDELDELEPFMVDGWKTVMVELREVTS
jgi:hypothetical protein